MLGLLFGLINLALNLYKLLVLAHFILTLAKAPANKWTTLLASVVEPALAPLRKLISQHLPRRWQICDWSPVALVIVIALVQAILF